MLQKPVPVYFFPPSRPFFDFPIYLQGATFFLNATVARKRLHFGQGGKNLCFCNDREKAALLEEKRETQRAKHAFPFSMFVVL